MPYLWKRERSPYYTAVFKDETNTWVKKTTKQTNRAKAMTLAIEWERAASMARDGVITESICREVLGGILERTTGDKLRSSTLGEFCDEWIKGKQNAREEGTSTRYESTITRFREFLGKKTERPVAAVDARDCQRFYDYLEGLGLAPATLVVEMKTIISLFNHARRIGLISNNPAAVVQLPERIQQVQRRTFTPEQIKLLLAQAESEWRTAILLGYYAGLRLGDAVTLEWSAVELLDNKIVFKPHKTKRELEIPLHPTLSAHLQKIAGDSTGPLCPTLSTVTVGGRSGLSKQFLAIMRKAGIGNDAVDTGGQRKLSRLSFHALRASFNSTLHNKGVDQELRMKLTGHKSERVNDRYTETELSTLRDAICKMPAVEI